MMIADSNETPLSQHGSHSRNWRQNHYVYPVISRRSGGLSIGINLSPDAVCNFGCVYCQVDRAAKRRTCNVDIPRLRDELARMIASARDQSLFNEPRFSGVPEEKRSIKDIAFSGDGEPTASPAFRESIDIAAAVKAEARLEDTRIVLITNASCLTRPDVVSALAVMDENNGEIWAKLDAGTEAHFRRVNRAQFPLQRVIDNIIAAARVRPLVIQSLFMRIDGEPPDDVELSAYVDRLNEITRAGGKIAHVQIYTVARRPAETRVEALLDLQVDHIAEMVRDRTGLQARPFYGVR